jgi:hypothetical protein
MGQGRFEIEEELVVDSVDLRQSRIRPRSRDNWLTQKGRALGLGGTESGLGGAGTGRGGAGEPSQAGLCAYGNLPGGAAADLGPGRDRVRLEIARVLPILICAGWGVPCWAW